MNTIHKFLELLPLLSFHLACKAQEKSGVADAMDYAMENGEWTWENDLALFLFMALPFIAAAIAVGLIIYVIVKLRRFRKENKED